MLIPNSRKQNLNCLGKQLTNMYIFFSDKGKYVIEISPSILRKCLNSIPFSRKCCFLGKLRGEGSNVRFCTIMYISLTISHGNKVETGNNCCDNHIYRDSKVTFCIHMTIFKLNCETRFTTTLIILSFSSPFSFYR